MGVFSSLKHIFNSKSRKKMSGSLQATSNNNLSETSTAKNGQAYRFQEGRRYLEDENIAYVLPNDDEGISYLFS